MIQSCTTLSSNEPFHKNSVQEAMVPSEASLTEVGGELGSVPIPPSPLTSRDPGTYVRALGTVVNRFKNERPGFGPHFVSEEIEAIPLFSKLYPQVPS